MKRVSDICNVLGMGIIILVMLVCIPMTLPKIFGYQVFHIMSGSMEPALPTGSAIYVEKVSPQEIICGDVIAFRVADEVVAHRVVKNEKEEAQILTKGDANAAQDKAPVLYEQVIGRVAWSIPYAGFWLSGFSSLQGKGYLLLLLLGGVLFRVAAGCIQKSMPLQEKERENPRSHTKAETYYRFIRVLMIVMVIAFLIVAGILVKTLHRYQTEKKTDEEAGQTYTQTVYAQLPKTRDNNQCPLTVNFEALKKVNEEIVAWIYCEDTVINYPVCRADNDEYYLTHAYNKKSKTSGSIFLETANRADCTDANLILYGHHMKNKTMFATLLDWAEQSYYEEHPYMWLLTPQATYRVDLFSGYRTDAFSDTYTVFQGYAPQLATYLTQAWEKSNFTAKLADLERAIEEDDLTDKKFIVMSTCDYSFENARYVLHGYLVETEKR